MSKNDSNFSRRLTVRATLTTLFLLLIIVMLSSLTISFQRDALAEARTSTARVAINAYHSQLGEIANLSMPVEAVVRSKKAPRSEDNSSDKYDLALPFYPDL